MPYEQTERHHEQRNTDVQTVGLWTLVYLQCLRNDESGGTESRVAARDRSSHDAQHCQYSAQHTEPVVAHEIDNHRCRSVESFGSSTCNLLVARLRSVVEEPHSHRSPNQSYHSLSNHCTIEYGSSLAFRLQAASHQRTLRSVKTANCATGYSDEEAGEDAVGEPGRVGLLSQVAQSVPQFGQNWHLHEQHHHQSHSHKQQREREYGVYLADNLVDRQHRCHDVVGEDNAHPHHLRTAHVSQYLSRTVHEYRSDHNKQEYGKHQQHLGSGTSEILAYKRRQVATTVAQRKHAREVVVNGSCKDASEYNPQIGNGSELGAHDSSEDRTSARNVQKLNHEHLPVGHRHVVNAVGFGYSRGGAVVGSEYVLYETAIDCVAQYEGYETNYKCYHFLVVISCDVQKYNFLLRNNNKSST